MSQYDIKVNYGLILLGALVLGEVSDKFIKSHLPMTETAFYVLLSLQVPRHGYGIIKYTSKLTSGRIKLGSGTIYGTINKMLRDGMIEVYDDRENKIIYVITEVGKAVLDAEKERIVHLYRDSLTAETED